MISYKKLHTCVLLITALITLPHCAKYRPNPLNAPYNRTAKNDIEVGARELTQAEFKQSFDSALNLRSYAPVQLSINNNSDKPVVLDTANINLSLLPVHDVAKKIHRNTAGRVCAWGIAGLFIWPFLIPAIVDGIWSTEANRDIDQDIYQRALGGSTVVEIAPHSSFNKLMVAHRSNFKSDMKITLVNQQRNSVAEFSIPLTTSC